MFLKNVEIFGFKSFADKSKLDFGEGISTIIGPNGCGKSNIVEAIRWVLGEQSVKGIRLEKMENVIFNGTEQRHPLNVAEVTLTFSNENNILPLEFSEVSIKRRIFRSSNSEYYINGVQVLLKELRELLADTGIGVTEYMVMEQGRIDQILEAKPVERRSVLEEAAGIKKYRIRSFEGTRRREKMQDNIVQIEQILQEVEKQHKTLKHQSEKAIRYRDLSSVVFGCEVTLICKKHEDFKHQLESAKLVLADTRDKLSKEEHAQKILQEEADIFQTDLKSREDKIIEHQRRLSAVHAEKDAIKHILKANLEHIEEIKEQRTTLEAQLKNYQLRCKELEKELINFKKDRGDQNKNLSLVKNSIKDVQQKTANNTKEMARLKDSQSMIIQREAHIGGALEEYQKELRTVVDRLAEELDKRISQAGYSANLQNKLEAEVLNIHQQLKHQVMTLKNFITDSAISKETIQIQDIKKYIDALHSISSIVDEVFFNYRDAVPTFLNEFLENDGVLSHKHLIDEKINTLHNDREACRVAKKDNTTRLESLDKDTRKLQERIHELELQINTYVQNIDSITKDEQRVKRNLQEINEQILAQEIQLKGLGTAFDKWKDEYVIYEKKFQELDIEDNSIHVRIETLRKEISIQCSEADVYQKKLDGYIDKIKKIQLDIQTFKEKVTEINTRVHMLGEDFRDRYGEMINIYLTDKDYIHKTKEDSTSIKQRLAHTKQEISSLGNVNLLAAEEFESVDDRYNHLTSQLLDLRESDTNLQAIIEKIEVESRQKMEKTFIEVRKYFKTIFNRMMGGGKADLLLVESEDILNSGLEIIAQPPEKKTQYLSQLSGGERTLIALSLLFALHSVKPAPFCLLDELDAALDDKNVDRLLNLLHSFKDVTQFVVISHNKRTIVQSQDIIGVTMEERGVSKIIGVRVEEDEKVS